MTTNHFLSFWATLFSRFQPFLRYDTPHHPQSTTGSRTSAPHWRHQHTQCTQFTISARTSSSQKSSCKYGAVSGRLFCVSSYLNILLFVRVLFIRVPFIIQGLLRSGCRSVQYVPQTLQIFFTTSRCYIWSQSSGTLSGNEKPILMLLFFSNNFNNAVLHSHFDSLLFPLFWTSCSKSNFTLLHPVTYDSFCST